MAKTASGLVAFVKTKLKTNYVYGMKGAVMTSAKFAQLRRMYPSTIPASDVRKVGTVCVDCSGLISWYTGVLRSSSNQKSVATKVRPISAIKEAVPGCALWRSGHIGVYIGNGLLIEARGSAYGTVLSKVRNRNFTHILWLKDIDYSAASTTPTVKTDIVRTKSNLNMRTAPDKTSASIMVIQAGKEVSWISDAGNGWSKVTYSGKTGYCSNKYLVGKSGLSTAPSANTTQTTSALTLRSEPNPVGSVVTIMPNKATVEIVEDTGWGWSKVKYNGNTGYCSNAYLTAKLSTKKTMKNTGTSRVNIRSSCSSSRTANIVGKLAAKGSFVANGYRVVGSSKWLRTTVNGVSGWIFYDPSYIK